MFSRGFSFILLVIPGYVSSLDAALDASTRSPSLGPGSLNESFVKAFCERMETMTGSLSDDDRRETARLTDVFCKESFLESLKDMAPMKVCAEKVEKEITESCGKIKELGDCSAVEKSVKCQGEIFKKHCSEIQNIGKRLVTFNQAALFMAEKHNLAACESLKNETGIVKYCFVPLFLILLHLFFKS